MLHILLLILKIVGIIIAVLIGCILLSLCLALFLPIHYKVELRREEGEGCPPVEVKAKVTWMLHLINIRVLYPSDIYLKVRILFFTLFKMPDKNKGEKKKKNSKSENRKKQSKKDKSEEKEDNIKKTENLKTEEKAEEDEEGVGNRKSENKSVEITDEETQYTKEKISLISKLNKILSLFKNIWYTIIGICDKIKEVLDNIEYYLDIIKSDMFKQAFSLCKDELISIVNYVKPRTFIADFVIGMDDPATTGQILSYYGILYPLIGNNVTVTGDFERKRIEGSVFFKGRIKLFTFLKALIRIYFSKDIRKLLKLFKKEDA